MNRFEPAGALAIVTGASGGIGRELVRLLAMAGARVIANARREQRLHELCEDLRQLPQPVTLPEPLAGDVAEPAVRDRLIQRAAELGEGRLDLLVNNAGMGGIGPYERATPERLRRIMEVNFFAPAELTRAAIPLLRNGRKPVICNIGSVLGHRAVANKSEYCASKFALHGWSDSLRAELNADGIQVTLVSPSTTRSEFFASALDSAPTTATFPWGSWSAERVARATLAAIRSRRSEVILSVGGKALVYADRICPPLMNRLLAVRPDGSNTRSRTDTSRSEGLIP